MKPVVLPVLCHDESTALFNELGINYSYNDLNEVEFLFFNIDFACGNTRDGKEFTEIVSGEDSYVVNLTFNEFKKLFI